MPVPTDEHYIDTNVVIECYRVGCWKALGSNYQLATVDKVIEECATGAGRREGYVQVDIDELKKGIRSHAVSNTELANLRLRLAGKVNLDPGEEHLLAKAVTNQASWSICSPDNALVRACWVLDCLNRVVSLESLLKHIGCSPRIPMQRQYTESWLSHKRTDLLLESA